MRETEAGQSPLDPARIRPQQGSPETPDLEELIEAIIDSSTTRQAICDLQYNLLVELLNKYPSSSCLSVEGAVVEYPICLLCYKCLESRCTHQGQHKTAALPKLVVFPTHLSIETQGNKRRMKMSLGFMLKLKRRQAQEWQITEGIMLKLNGRQCQEWQLTECPLGERNTKIQKEMKTSPESLQGSDQSANIKHFTFQMPESISKKIIKSQGRKTADTDFHLGSPAGPQQQSPSDVTSPSSHKRQFPQKGRKRPDRTVIRAPREQPKVVSASTSTTDLHKTGQTAPYVAKPLTKPKPATALLQTDGASSYPAAGEKKPKPGTLFRPGNRVPLHRRILSFCKQTFAEQCSKMPELKFTKSPFWQGRASKGIWAP
ncbi:hypothetical protein Y1Q_0003031 [Alligator mississippiensis]|uniref:Uncharacterized protein n=1 Tax=Alligator mississippiensis TaxID=8496 RepID=A0A151MD71_ALLMI|nr:hypothetical protein Y1Q_0003031 [Alligator mississippiensis]